MRVLLLSVLLVLAGVAISYETTYPVKRVVVLMMENRSFDHLLGYLMSLNKNIDGVDGTEYQLVNVNDPSSKKYYINPNGPDVAPDDPGHGFDDTAEQIYGFDTLFGSTPLMNGFVQNANEKSHSLTNPVSMFTNSTAPIINTLGYQFGIIDKWFCSIPGPTDPNRAFAMSGTSDGQVTNFNGTLWNQQSYFDFLGKHGITWRAFYQDDPWAIMYFQDMQTSPNYDSVGQFDQFFTDLDNGYLSQFTWLQPRMNTHADGPPNWQHPDASVKEGEKLIKQVYEALRASPFWNEVVFVLTYDEHGGFYDHVTPPQTGVPSPDGVKASNGFTFNRLGVRIPAVIVSPYIPLSTVEHAPTNGPSSTSQYDSTSIIATANKLFGITDHMTARDAWAGTFEGMFSLSTPRTDCPMTLPSLPAYTAEEDRIQRARPLNDHQQIQVDFYCKFNNRGEDCGKDLRNQEDAGLFITAEVAHFMHNLREKNSLSVA